MGTTIVVTAIVLAVAIFSIIRQRRGLQDKMTTYLSIGSFTLIEASYLIARYLF